jgi:trehalose 6-phosphate phosphatase
VSRSRHTPPRPQLDWAWFFDVDGTLLEIASSPARVVVHDELAPAIVRLNELSGGAVSLITGRSITNIDTLLDLPEIAIAGQHGLELRWPSGKTVSREFNKKAFGEICDRLTTLVANHPGLILELKGMSVALHYRLAPRLAGYVHRTMRELQRLYPSDFTLQKGKRVVELKPVGADKGQVIRELMTSEPFRGRVPVFIGDDLTDEAGFEAVNEMSGYSVKVGKGATAAKFQLPNVAGVRKWLYSAVEQRPAAPMMGENHK